MAVKIIIATKKIRIIFTFIPNISAIAPQTPAMTEFSADLTMFLLKFMPKLIFCVRNNQHHNYINYQPRKCGRKYRKKHVAEPRQ